MARSQENTGFVCANCGQTVEKLTNGSYRNHCPYCLHSLHVDIVPGDRAADCGALMVPVGLDYKRKKGWMVVHQCMGCGHVSRNKVAVNTDQSDDYEILTGVHQPNSRHPVL
ncbi:MAG: RNHCP domain-containing protein [Alphaproteobacteria bacterium]|nr:MAG: RNHCP domain-containing protein [Alphaproteobacteria bacterium]